MRRANETMCHRERRADHVGIEISEQGGRADDVHDCVDSPDLMEMHVVDRHLVDERFALTQLAEDPARERLRGLLQRSAREHLIDRLVGSERLGGLDMDLEASRHDRALLGVSAVEMKPFDRERTQGILDDPQRQPEIEQSSNGHVACDAAEGIEEQHLPFPIPPSEETGDLIGVSVLVVFM
jgi:hypothetical protein